MPVRLLREGILDSEAVCSLSFPAEVFYRRLMSVVDDFGRFDARPSVLRSRLYPLQVDKVREADITRWSAECAKAGLIVFYAVARAGSSRWIAICEKAGLAVSANEQPYLLFHKIGVPRAASSKFPAPPPSECEQTQTYESNGKQTLSDVPYSYSSSGSYSGREEAASGTHEEKKPAAQPKPKPKPPAEAVLVPSALNTPLFLAAWSDWLDERKTRSKSLTERAARSQLAALEPLGEKLAIECIRLSITNGWTGLFPDRFAAGTSGKPGQRHATKAEAQDDYLARMMADCIPATTNQQPQLPRA